MDVLERLVQAVQALHPERRIIVAVDGPDAAGKSTLAGTLAERITRPVVCSSIDGWHNPRAIRIRRGDESPEGYYADAFDHDALLRELLQPFRAGASTLVTQWFDHRADEPRRTEVTDVPANAALLLEGVFLLRPELRRYWDLAVYLHVPEEVTVARAVVRDVQVLGGEDAVRERYAHRYLPAQTLYREAASPMERADIVLENSDAAAPVILRWAGSVA